MYALVQLHLINNILLQLLTVKYTKAIANFLCTFAIAYFCRNCKCARVLLSLYVILKVAGLINSTNNAANKVPSSSVQTNNGQLDRRKTINRLDNGFRHIINFFRRKRFLFQRMSNFFTTYSTRKLKSSKWEIDCTDTILYISTKAHMEGLKIVYSSPHHFVFLILS